MQDQGGRQGRVLVGALFLACRWLSSVLTWGEAGRESERDVWCLFLHGH